MANTKRTAQVAERIRECVAMMLVRGEISDPRVKNVTIQAVKVSPDLQIAKVYFSVLGAERERHEALDGFTKASGYIRNAVGKSLQIRYTPELHFYLDETVENAVRISSLLNKIAEERQENETEDAPVNEEK